jgi:hypothetical protein
MWPSRWVSRLVVEERLNERSHLWATIQQESRQPECRAPCHRVSDDILCRQGPTGDVQTGAEQKLRLQMRAGSFAGIDPVHVLISFRTRAEDLVVGATKE